MLYISISWDICDPELIHQPYWDTTEREEIAEVDNKLKDIKNSLVEWRFFSPPTNREKYFPSPTLLVSTPSLKCKCKMNSQILELLNFELCINFEAQIQQCLQRAKSSYSYVCYMWPSSNTQLSILNSKTILTSSTTQWICQHILAYYSLFTFPFFLSKDSSKAIPSSIVSIKLTISSFVFGIFSLVQLA